LLLVGFGGALRRSDLVALDVADIQETETGLLVKIRGSKTDQERAGATIAIARGNVACPAKALLRLRQSHFMLGLIAQTEALQERRWLGILHRLVLCCGVLCGRDMYLCILLPPDLCLWMSLGPDLCPRILHGRDVSVLFHGPDLWSGILHNLCWRILSRPYDLCPWILLRRPSLVLLVQGIGIG